MVKKTTALLEGADHRGIDGNDPTTSNLDNRALAADKDLWTDELLPDLSQYMPGWHCCWASRTNNRESVEVFQRRGYEFVTKEHLGEHYEGLFLQVRQSSGDYGTSDLISCNEMVAMRIPDSAHHKNLTRFHAREPLEQQQGMIEKLNSGKLQYETSKDEADGMADTYNQARKARTQTQEFFVNKHNLKEFQQ